MTFTSDSRFSFVLPLRRDRKARESWGWVFPFPQILVKQFTSEANLIKTNRMLWEYKMTTFSILLAGRTKGFFSCFYCESLIGLLEVKLKVWELAKTRPPLEFL